MKLSVKTILSLLINLVSPMTTGFDLLNGHTEVKNIYISSRLIQGHRRCVFDAVSIFNSYSDLYEPIGISTVYDRGCVRIAYSKLRPSGFTVMRGSVDSSNEWTVDDSTIYINPDIEYPNACTTIILHELCHTRGLWDNHIEGSIMNISIPRPGLLPPTT